MAGSGPGYGGRPRKRGVSVDGHIDETKDVKRASQKWGSGDEEDITVRRVRVTLCVHGPASGETWTCCDTLQTSELSLRDLNSLNWKMLQSRFWNPLGGVKRSKNI